MKRVWKSFMTVTAASAVMTAAMAFPSLAAAAKIGETEYEDLQTAVDSAGTDPVVIDLMEDVTLTDGLVVGAGKKVTIQSDAKLPKTIRMEGLGIHTEGTLDDHCSLTLKDCNVDAVLNDNPGHGGETVNLIGNTEFTLDHVNWKLVGQEEELQKHGIFLYQASNFYVKNGSRLVISGFNGSGSSGIYADESEYENLGLFHINVSGQSVIDISDCGWNGMTINPTDLTVEGRSEIHVTNCGLSGGRGGIGCYYGKIDVKDRSVITADRNVGRSWGIFVKDFHVDETSRVSACGNTGYGIEIGGEGEIEDGARLELNGNSKSGLWVYASGGYWLGDVKIKSGGIVSACENGESGIYNKNKFCAEEGAELKIERNKDHGINNLKEMTLNAGSILENHAADGGAGIFNSGTLNVGSGVRVCNNHADVYGGGLYNGENGTAELAEGVILYNNHGDTGADDIYNTAGQKLTFGTVGNGWNLNDCDHRIDGWYDDTEGTGTRWNADAELPEDRHIVLFAPGAYETGFQIKAAHGADIYETTDYPIDKKANGEDEIGTVRQGEKIRFTLTSRLPKLLARYVETASNASPANAGQKIRRVRVHSASGAWRASGADAYDYEEEISEQVLLPDEKYLIPDSVVEIMVFHDEMNRYLELVDGTIRVKAGRDLRELPSDYYEVKASDSNAFRVEIDLVKLFNSGIIDYEDLTEESPIEVSYEAVVADDVIQGDELSNEAWVNDGEHDSVEGDVLDGDVPSTGGTGRGMFTWMGIFFMGTAAAVSLRGKKKYA